MKSPQTRNQAIAILESYLQEGDADWENMTSNEMLESIVAWLSDADGYYKNTKPEVDSDAPSWQLLVDAIIAGTVYE